MENVHGYMWPQTPSIIFTAGNKTRLFPTPFHVSTRLHLTLAEDFTKNHVTAGSTALLSATEENESCGYVTVPCLSKVTQHSSTPHWLKFY